jgi:site-specific recombinase XerD
MEFLTQSELLAVLKQAKSESARDFALILTIYKHGLRSAEAAGLTLDNLRDGCLDVIRKKGSLHTLQPVTGHVGESLLDETKALKHWLKVRRDDGSRALFTSQKGGHLSREQVHRIFRGIAERAGLPERKRHVHALKHSRASHLVGHVDLAYVRQVLGHKSIASTMLYAHTDDATAMKAAQSAEMQSFRGML